MHQQENETTKSDLGTDELRQHHIVVVTETSEVRRRAQVRTSVPIDYYLDRGWISQRQWDAANDLYTLWYYGAVKSQHSMSRMDAPLPKKGCYAPAPYNPTEKAIIMEKKYNDAIKSIPSLVTRLVVYNVVCMGEWAAYLESMFNMQEAKIGKNRRLVVLREGLDAVAKHFRIPESGEKKSVAKKSSCKQRESVI